MIFIQTTSTMILLGVKVREVRPLEARILGPMFKFRSVPGIGIVVH